MRFVMRSSKTGFVPGSNRLLNAARRASPLLSILQATSAPKVTLNPWLALYESGVARRTGLRAWYRFD